MSAHTFRRTLVWVHRFFNFLVRSIFVLVVFAAVLFIYLRTNGLPDFVLKKVMQRVNDAGVPVSVERIVLTMGGWRADRIRYYSENPDDLEPLFFVEKVYFSVLKNPDKEGMNIDVDMQDLLLTPSVKWNVKIPENSNALRLKRIQVGLDFSPNEILLLDGETTWLDFRFHINGKILKGEKSHTPDMSSFSSGDTISFSEEQFKALEKQLEIFDLPSGADVHIDFLVDTEEHEKSKVDFSLLSENVSIQKVPFSKVEIKGGVKNAEVQIDRIVLAQNKKSIQLSGHYNWTTQQTQIWLFNSICSTDLFTFIPENVQKQILELGLEIHELPQLDIHFGPATFSELLNNVKGSFYVRDVAYEGLMIQSARGKIKRVGQRIEINNVQAKVEGQKENAKKVGSSMLGGDATGSVFWDGDSREFGVEGDVNFDPNLLLKPLANADELAVEITDYFKFKNKAPNAHVEVGAMVDDWNTFYLTIKGTAKDGWFRGVEFSSLNTKVVYKDLTLRLDPLVVFQGTSFLKGAAFVDLDKSTAEFDGTTTLNPADLEAAIYPSALHLFSDQIKMSGKMLFAGEGVVDWSTEMKKMDFTVSVSADHIEIPAGYAQNIKTTVVGKGPVISVKNSTFSLCEGSGDGGVRIYLNALPDAIPYEVDATFTNVNLQKIVLRYSKEPVDATGDLSGSVNIRADMATNFFDKAVGVFSVKIQDGMLSDLPLFASFSKAIRFIMPSFKTFSIESLVGDFQIRNGKISSKEVVFQGDVISAVGRGSFSSKTGFDALIQTHFLKKKGLLGIVDFVTSPFTKIFEMHLTGPRTDPSWRLGTFTRLKDDDD